MTATIDHDAPPPPDPAPSGPPSIPRWALVSFIVGGLAFLAIAVAAMSLPSGEESADDGTGPWRGRLVEPAPERPDALLVDTAGQPFDLRAETGGRFTLLFFGYTSCPDACPIQMAQLAQAVERVRLPIDVVFVTTDPERDTPERIRSWLDGFDSSFIGLTGTPEQLDQLQTDMQVSVAIRDEPDAAGDYLVGHSTAVFVVTPDDRAHLAYPTGTRLEDWVNDLPEAFANDDWKAARS